MFWSPDGALPDLDGAEVTVVVEPSAAATDGVSRLVRAGVPLLGRVDLGFAARPLAEVLADVRAWSPYRVDGLFLDRAPADPFGAGPVALALRVAGRAGLARAVVNPGCPPDPVYRTLGATLCVFDGDWEEYTRWDGAGARPGDGHLVRGVPPRDVPEALRLAADRGAGLVLAAPR